MLFNLMCLGYFMLQVASIMFEQFAYY